MTRTDKLALAVFVAGCFVVLPLTGWAWGRYQNARRAEITREVAMQMANNPTPTACTLSAINTRSAAIAEGVMNWGDELVAEVVP